MSPPDRFSYPPSRWASQLDKAQGLHLHLRCDDAEAPSPSSSALTLLSAGNPTSFSSLTIGQPRTVKYACHVSLRHLYTEGGRCDARHCGLNETLRAATRLGLVSKGPLVPACICPSPNPERTTGPRLSTSSSLPQDFVCDEAVLAGLFRFVGLSALTLGRGSLKLPGLQALVGCLGALSRLSSLDLADNALGDAGAAALAPALPLLAGSLRRLCLSGNGFNAEGVAELALTMTSLTALQALELNDSLSEVGSVPALVPCLAQLTALTLLKLGRNRVDEAGLAALVPCLAQLTALQHLDLGTCFLGDEGTSPLLPSLGAALGKLVSLTQLEMSSNELFDEGATALANGLLHLTALHHLDVANNLIEEAGFDALAPTLMHMPALRCLDLCENAVNESGAVDLMLYLRRCSGLEQLKLQYSGINVAGAAALSGLLREHLRSLQLLTLRNCLEMGSAGVFSLAGGLRGLVSLRHLELCKVCNDTHPDGPDAAGALAAALAGLTGLTHLDLRANDGFGEAGSVAIGLSVRGLTRLRYLDCSACCAGDRGMMALCCSLRGLSRLQHLDLANNQRGDCSGVLAALGPALPSLTALTQLNLSHNDLDEEVAAALVPGLSGLTRLRSLNMEHNCFGDGGVLLLGDGLTVSRCQNVCICIRMGT